MACRAPDRRRAGRSMCAGCCRSVRRCRRRSCARAAGPVGERNSMRCGPRGRSSASPTIRPSAGPARGRARDRQSRDDRCRRSAHRRRRCLPAAGTIVALSRRLAARDGPIVPVHLGALSAGIPGRRGLAQRQHGGGRRQCQPDDDRLGREAAGAGSTGPYGTGRPVLFVDAQQLAGRLELHALGLALLVGERPGEDLGARHQQQPRPLEVPAGGGVGDSRSSAGAGASASTRPRPARIDRFDIKTPPMQLSIWQVTGPRGATIAFAPPGLAG